MSRSLPYNPTGENGSIISLMKRRRPLSAQRKPLARSWMRNKLHHGFHGYPVATIAFYGPTDKLATKVAVSIILAENSDPDFLERWFSEGELDVRHDPAVGECHRLPQGAHSPLHRGCRQD